MSSTLDTDSESNRMADHCYFFLSLFVPHDDNGEDADGDADSDGGVDGDVEEFVIPGVCSVYRQHLPSVLVSNGVR